MVDLGGVALLDDDLNHIFPWVSPINYLETSCPWAQAQTWLLLLPFALNRLMVWSVLTIVRSRAWKDLALSIKQPTRQLLWLSHRRPWIWCLLWSSRRRRWFWAGSTWVVGPWWGGSISCTRYECPQGVGFHQVRSSVCSGCSWVIIGLAFMWVINEWMFI